ncbi:hypothetical protein L7F22_068060 [Adiantum nelumboides]|nr:hypothetical protein [Adiantum nelumboides]
MEKSRYAVLEQKQEQFYDEWKEVKKGNTNRKAWEEKLGERKKVDANIRSHELIGKILLRNNVGVGQAVLDRLPKLKANQKEIQTEMNTIKKQGRHDPELEKVHAKQYDKEETKIYHAKKDSNAAITRHDDYINDNTNALRQAYNKHYSKSKYSPSHLVKAVKNRIRDARDARKKQYMLPRFR